MRIIFHIPYEIDPDRFSGSTIRPGKMLQAFENKGLIVDRIMGDVKTRRKQIRKIRKNIKNGMRYDFLYSESSTSPTLLTGRTHIPKIHSPDFRFFNYCKKNGIPIGLFYRDIHWNFPEYRNALPGYKILILKIFFKYDLYIYKKLVDILFLPSLSMLDYIPLKFEKRVRSLQPGSDPRDTSPAIGSEVLSFIYVGGSGSFYDLEVFLKAISIFKKAEFILCTRKDDWEKIKEKYKKYLQSNVKVIFKQGEALKSLYANSDIAVLFFKPIKYMKFAAPLKLFEYIAYKKPVIAVSGTFAGDFADGHKIGWVTDYNEEALLNLIKRIEKNRNEINERIRNIEIIMHDHTWEARAEKAIKDFEEIKKPMQE